MRQKTMISFLKVVNFNNDACMSSPLQTVAAYLTFVSSGFPLCKEPQSQLNCSSMKHIEMSVEMHKKIKFKIGLLVYFIPLN